MLFARNVQFQLKADKRNDFARQFNSDVLPMLKNQKGFKEELTLMTGDRCMAISVWQDRPSAEAYHTSTYPQILQKLGQFIEGTPKVDTYDVPVSSTTT